MTSMSSMTGPTAALAFALLAARGVTADTYEFTLVAETGAGGFGAGFTSIQSAALSHTGLVTFAGTDEDGTAVYLWVPGENAIQIAGPDQGFLVAHSPVISAAGFVAFLGQTEDVRLGIFLVPLDADGGGAQLLVDADDPDFPADLLGQLSMDAVQLEGIGAVDVAYWSACIGGFLSGCEANQQCIASASGPPIECVSAPMSLAAPALNDLGSLVWLRGGADGTISLRGTDIFGYGKPLPLVTVADGLISSPSINDLGQVAVFLREEGVYEPGIYLVTEDEEPALLVGLLDPPVPDDPDDPEATCNLPVGSQIWDASIRARINDPGAVAYPATLVADGGFGPPQCQQAIFVTGCPDPVIVADGDEYVDGSLVLYGFNDLGQVLLTAHRTDGSKALLLGDIEGDEPTCPGDIVVDGEVDVQDLTALVLAWETDDADADLNGDGIVDVEDLTTLVIAWGPCPPG